MESDKEVELYIPLQGKYTTNSEEEPFDLAQKINEFFVFDDTNPSDPRVMLLLGETGSGKSVITQQIFQQLWSTRKDGDPIPLWIPLPELLNPFENVVEEVLTTQAFSETQIAEMKANAKFIFIVDGYDELHQFQNCYVTNHWDQWNAKILITCRSQALYYQKDPDKYFVPFDGEKRLPWLLRKLYVAPFSTDQIKAYVEAYNRLFEDLRINIEDFDKVPGLKELITTPFLLHLTVESLPDILADQQTSEDYQKITQARLYDVFVERWFTRQVKKLHIAGQQKDSEQKTKQLFWDYCKRLAQRMHAKELTVIPYTPPKTGGRLFGKQEKKEGWEEFFSEDTEISRSSCPLKRMGDHHYGFIHASLVEYFATRAMYEEITQDVDTPVEFEEQPSCHPSEGRGLVLMAEVYVNEADLHSNNIQPRGGIYQRLFSEEKNSIRFLADRIEMSKTFKQKMLMIIETSKKNEHFAIGAANAITALVKAGVTFNGADLSGVNISGADLSGGYFDQANFKGSDLSHVRIASSWLRQACFVKSRLDGLDFGEYPWIEHEKENRPYEIKSIVYRPDINRLVTTLEKDIKVWNIETGVLLQEFKCLTADVKCISLSGDGKTLVSCDNNIVEKKYLVRVWDIENGQLIKILEGHKDIVSCVFISEDAKTIVSCEQYGFATIRIWDVSSGDAKEIYGLDHISCVYLSKDGKTLAAGCFDGTVLIRDLSNGKVNRLNGHMKNVNSICLSADAKLAVSGSDDKTVRVWDVFSKNSIILEGHEDCIHSVHLSQDGKTVVSGSDDNTVRIWEIESRKARVIKGINDRVRNVQLSYNGKTLAATENNIVHMWNLSVPQQNVEQKGHLHMIATISLSANGKKIATGGLDETACVWDVTNGNVKMCLKGHSAGIDCIYISDDGDTVISGAWDDTVRLWDMSKGESRVLADGGVIPSSVGMSTNKKIVVSSGGDNNIRVWDLESGNMKILCGHTANVAAVCISVDGKTIASASHDKTVRIWDVASERSMELGSHDYCFVAIHLSDDKKTVVSSTENNKIYIWDVASRDCIILESEEEGSGSIFLSHDKKSVFSGMSKAQKILVWDIELRTHKTIIQFCSPFYQFSLNDTLGLLAVGFLDGIVQVWQRIGSSNETWQLRWSSNFPNSTLFLNESDFSGSTGLSLTDQRLLKQRRAILTPSEGIVSSVARRSGSPLHQHDNSVTDTTSTEFTNDY